MYLVYPLIEESERVDLESLEKGYEDIKKAVRPPKWVWYMASKPRGENAEMEAFAKGDTHILVRHYGNRSGSECT